jgi:Holliday junction resolvasome RuvABC endonuclease subunit
MNIKIVGVDPAIRNFGYAQGTFDTSNSLLSMQSIALVTTEKNPHKTIRRNSDDLSRAQHHQKALIKYCAGMNIAIAELPTGTQSARGAMSNGIALGVMASCPIALIQVMPDEVKMAAVGHKQASKEEMIEWAMEKYPFLPWLTIKRKGLDTPVAANEHLADAIAVIHAGILTQQFEQAQSFWRQAA